MFDSRLLALAECSVIPLHPSEGKDAPEHSGGIIFDPYPSIVASNDLVLSHELCHLLAGKRDYDIFLTAVTAKNSPLFSYILNLLYDWYHEMVHEDYSPFLAAKVAELHEETKKIEIPAKILEVEELSFLIHLYMTRSESPKEAGINSCHDLVFLASKLYTSIIKRLTVVQIRLLIEGLEDLQIKIASRELTGAGSSTYGSVPQRSNFYARTVSKYGATINLLKSMWTRNKYDWVKKHHGEIDWKNLTRVFMGEKLTWPVFLILSKIILKKRIYLCIDRSSSTNSDYKNTGIRLKVLIMELSVIIAESLRLCNTPVTVLEVGVQNKIINPTGELDTSWYTPMAENDTPLGRVCSTIREKDVNSMLIIITDGAPDSFEQLAAAIHRFPGENVNFVIGESYSSYASQIKNSVLAEPHTILRDLKNFVERGGNL
jgi:hypothetical protein